MDPKAIPTQKETLLKNPRRQIEINHKKKKEKKRKEKKENKKKNSKKQRSLALLLLVSSKHEHKLRSTLILRLGLRIFLKKLPSPFSF